MASKIISAAETMKALYPAQTSPSLLADGGNTVRANNGLGQSTRLDKVNKAGRASAARSAQQICASQLSWLDKSVQLPMITEASVFFVMVHLCKKYICLDIKTVDTYSLL